ncbi:ABC-2 transporter permease [Clostridium sp.]|uniref:ABC-2 transporter permease n=1 Tax=Clostridium sp. TaxID=1506 RepID=UPI00262033A6|nr:ABC-2 transporter permease [Clostridium sp.]
MNNSINYLKFDLRLIKESIKFYVLAPAVFWILFMFSGSVYMGLSYLFFFLVIFATVPFSAQSNEKSTQMYYMFPCKISEMVCGRFLYLISVAAIIFLIDGTAIIYSYMTQKLHGFEVVVISFCGILSLITCFIQYPIYYKFGMEKGNAISILVYLLPAFLIFGLPSFLIESGNSSIENFINSLNYIFSNSVELLLLSVLILCIVGCLSYLISYKICKAKEI